MKVTELLRCPIAGFSALEDRYEYDVFGQLYSGDLTSAMNLGYTGKPYDTATGLYNYGYRDYKPQMARFTTVDPIRDGNNWFAYVNNDPVNYIDPWGLSATDAQNNELQTQGQNITSDATNFYSAMAGAEMIGLGSLYMTAGGLAITSTVAVGSGLAAGIAAGGWAVVVGAGIIIIGIDLITGNGLDKTKEFLNRFIRK